MNKGGRPYSCGRPAATSKRALFSLLAGLFFLVCRPLFPRLQAPFPLLQAIRVEKLAWTQAPFVASANYRYGLYVLCALCVEKSTITIQVSHLLYLFVVQEFWSCGSSDVSPFSTLFRWLLLKCHRSRTIV